MDEVKGKLIEEMNLEEITPEDIDNEAPLLATKVLALDSIGRTRNHSDSEREWYKDRELSEGKIFYRYVHWQTTSISTAKLNR